MSIKKYKKPLKQCKDCRYNFYVLKESGEKEHFCKIFALFLSQCDRFKEKVRR